MCLATSVALFYALKRFHKSPQISTLINRFPHLKNCILVTEIGKEVNEMTLSIVSQDGTVFNYSNAVASVVSGTDEKSELFGFAVFLNGDTENCITIAEYEDEERFNEVKKCFIQWLSDNIEPTFEFPS